ncbi:MAG TPA: 1-deoxy-D-xylulose-5-phosphate reductoisomerase [Desulfobacteraceae bacterium]|nr:1-deoxy-D-xylulose-5-phosphate reductoisomerase [Desulfobacteraceae bacterium]
MKNITLLGSTGSIGVNALKVIKMHPDQFRVAALGAGRNMELLATQIQHFHPSVVAVQDEETAHQLRRISPNMKSSEIFWGTKGFIELCALQETDTVISAMMGAAGLVPTFEAIRAGKNVALANKETMVMAGELVMAEAKKQGVSLLPIDSEHSAIFQSLQGHSNEDVKRIILTASGGPFRNFSLQQMAKVTPEDALNHPNWLMGAKITIDSSTLMNKGLEAIEAKWLFNIRMDQIKILVHPQSIVHSMVEYLDGSTIAQLGVPDMMIPIAYALSYPRHLENDLPPLDLGSLGTLSFEEPELDKFKCLSLALKAASTGGTMPTVLNAANEIAVSAFLSKKIGFLAIPDLIERTMDNHTPSPTRDIEQVMDADAWGRKTAKALLNEMQIFQ